MKSRRWVRQKKANQRSSKSSRGEAAGPDRRDKGLGATCQNKSDCKINSDWTNKTWVSHLKTMFRLVYTDKNYTCPSFSRFKYPQWAGFRKQTLMSYAKSENQLIRVNELVCLELAINKINQNSSKNVFISALFCILVITQLKMNFIKAFGLFAIVSGQ